MSTTVAIHVGSQHSAACYGDGTIIPLVYQDSPVLNNVLCYSSSQPYLLTDTSSALTENVIRYPLRLFDLTSSHTGLLNLSNLYFGSPVIQYQNSCCFHLSNGIMKPCDDAILDLIRCIYILVTKASNNIDSLALTIPSYYSYEMRERLNKCIQRAGCTSRGLFTEAECLVLNKLYSQKDYLKEVDNYFVLLIGANICECSFIKVRKGQLTEYPIFFQRNLGGNKVDELLLNYCEEELKRRHIDIYEGRKKENTPKLLDLIESGKEFLLSDECIEFSDLKESPSVDITNEKYLELLQPMIDAIQKGIVEGFSLARDRMEDPDISIDKVTKVILSGNLLLNHQPLENEIMKLFSVNAMKCGVNEELQGCIYHLQHDRNTAMRLLHPLNYSIGIGLDNNRVQRVILANSLLPVKGSLTWRHNGVLNNEINTAIFYGDMFINKPLTSNMKRVITIREKSFHFVMNMLFQTRLEVSKDGVLTITIVNMNNKVLYQKSIALPFC